MIAEPEGPVGIGAKAPEVDLLDTTGEHVDLSQDATATVVVFTCNHCPYAIGWEDRMLDVARDYAARGVRVYAINANDADKYPADSYEAMQRHVEEREWPTGLVPYLHDETQEVAAAFGAQTTPDVFLFDGDLKLRYRGALDESHENPSLNAEWLRSALDAVLRNKPVKVELTNPVGCSIKWK